MFNEHGTKILGVVVTVLGLVVGLAPDQLTALFGERAPGIVMALGGVLTVLRGLQNSGTLPGGPAATKKEG
jgi:hypothetical protein